MAIQSPIVESPAATENHGAIGVHHAQPAPTRVLLAGLPQMLEEILRRALAGAHGVELLDSVAADPAVVGALGVDVVVIAGDDRRAATRLLAPRSRPRVLALEHDGRETYLYELAPRRVELGEVSPRELVAHILAAAERPTT